MTDATPSPDLAAARSPRLRAHMEEVAARNRRLAEEAEGDRRRDAVLTALRCVAWMAAGVFCLLWSFHTTDDGYGRAAFFAGIGLGNGGIVFSLLGYYRRGEQRGDW